MDSPTSPTRRHVIAGAGAGLGAIALAGCGGDGDPDGSKPTGGKSPKEATSVAAGTTLATLSDITVGESKRVQSGGKPVIVARPSEDTAVAFSAICTHKGCTVAPAGKELHCPCHQSRFNATTGKVLGGPAPAPLHGVDVHVKDGKVVSGKE